jgi:hypothetical protein
MWLGDVRYFQAGAWHYEVKRKVTWIVLSLFIVSPCTQELDVKNSPLW